LQPTGGSIAQRALAHVDPALGPIVCHGAIEAINALYREAGIALAPTPLAMATPP
jgi:putative mRNA 3-end processing factor